MIEDILWAIAIWNGIVLLVFGLDKLLAKMGAYRVPEAVLLLLSFLVGGIGAVVGMFLFSHKIQKWKFRILLPLALLITAMGIGYIVYFRWT